MSRAAWAFIGTVLLLGLLIGAPAVAQLPPPSSYWLVFLVLTTTATAAQVWKARAPGHQSYHPAIIFFFAGLLLLPFGGFVLLVTTAHLLEWARERWTHSPRLRNWYLQPFNIACHILAGAGALLVPQALGLQTTPASTPLGALMGLLSALAYAAINHTVVGQVIVLARKVTWRESGIMEFENLLTDLVMLCLGQVLAFLYRANYAMIIAAISPLLLIYRALTVPQLKREAQIDARTGLLNAGQFVKQYEAELDRAKRFGRPLSLIMADLDLLRNVNNTYGHLAGDTVLERVGQLIRESTRTYDIAARFGGEEFVVVLPEAEVAQAHIFAERLRRAVESTDIEVRTSINPIRVTMSFGVATFPQDATAANDLVHEADLAVYQAKLSGRNCVVLAAHVPQHIKQGAPMAAQRLAETASTGYTPRPATSPAGQATTEGRPGAALPPMDEPPSPSAAAVPRRSEPPGEKAPPGGGPPASAHTTPYPRLAMWAVIAGTILFGATVSILGLLSAPNLHWPTIALFVALAAVTEVLQFDVYGESTISVGLGVNFAAAIVLGLPGVVFVGGTLAGIHWLRRHPVYYKTAFNWSAHVLAGAIPALLVRIPTLPITLGGLLWPLGLTVISALLYYAVETGLITTAVAFSQGLPLLSTWREHYQWLMIHYVIMGLIAFFVTVAFSVLGIPGLIVFALPLLMMRYSQRQYIRQTEHSVAELKRMNRELAAAHQDVLAANRSMQQLNEELFLVMAKIIDARDPFVSGHATKVRDYATAIATELEFPAERAEWLRQAGMLHDVGKIGISEQVLHKQGRLTPGEYAHVKGHATIGGDLLQTCQGLRRLAPFVRHHHERWDGCGYPDGLAGERIPLEARILALCDAVEAMASDRPYRRAMSLGPIVEELRRCSGTQFDPRVVDAFEQVISRQAGQLVTNSASQVSSQQNALSTFDPRAAWHSFAEGTEDSPPLGDPVMH